MHTARAQQPGQQPGQQREERRTLREHGPTRRALLGRSVLLSALVPVLGTASCGAGGRPAPAEPDTDVVVLRGAVRQEQALLARYAAARGRFPALAERLDPIAAHHREHLAALRRRLPTHDPASADVPRSPSAPPVWVPAPMPDTPDLALAALGADEDAAARSRVQHLARVSPPLAQLLASVGASEAGHAVLLADAR